MSFEQMVDQLEMIDQQGPHYFFALFQNPLFALSISFLLFTFFCYRVISFASETFIFTNRILRFYYRDLLVGGAFTATSIMMCCVGLFSSCIYVSYTYDDVLMPQREKVYLSYMEKQPVIQQSLDEVIWKTDAVSDMHYSDYETKTSYLYNWAICSNCSKQTILYKVDKEEEEYTKMDVFISYSLPEGEQPYLETKSPLREDVSALSKDALLNPVLYLSKSNWRFAK